MIQKCSDCDELTRIRFQIITEIMQSTVINKIKISRGIKLNKQMFSGPITLEKGDQLQARNLKRYINQLSFAKALCDKRIKDMNQINTQYENIREITPKTISFETIMNSVLCRSYLKKFMQYSSIQSSCTPEARRYLVVFWESVEEIRKIEENERKYEIAIQILSHSNFISGVVNVINVSKVVLKGMEEFVLGNCGPMAFYSAQTLVYQTLENRFYPLFLVSSEYYEMIEQFNETQTESENKSESELIIDDSNDEEVISDENSFTSNDGIIDKHLTQTKLKIDSIKSKIKDKTNALNALTKQSDKPLLTHVINMLNKQIEELSVECKQLENHYECSDAWNNGLGLWTSEVHNIELDIDNSDSYLVIIIIFCDNIDNNCMSNGWVITRTQKDFVEFRYRLIKKFAFIKSHEIPRLTQNKSIKVKENQLKLIRQHLQNFLNILTSDEIISKSEELYLFFSQSPKRFRQPLSSYSMSSVSKPITTRLPFANLFGISYTTSSCSSQSESVNNTCEDTSDEQFQILDEFESKDDTIAEPLYSFISELFDLRGVSNWLRRTIITFVQIAYGQTINKTLRLCVQSICSQSVIIYYLSLFRDSLWPNGHNFYSIASSSDVIDDQNKRRTELLAKQHLLNNIPDLISNVFGQQNTKSAINKLFDSIQNKQLNKQLFYELLESFMFEFAPELKD